MQRTVSRVTTLAEKRKRRATRRRRCMRSVRRTHTMAKQKRKLTSAQRRAKARRKAEFMIIFVNGKQKRVRRPGRIAGIDADEFIRRNADPMWLHQNGLWEYMPEDAHGGLAATETGEPPSCNGKNVDGA